MIRNFDKKYNWDAKYIPNFRVVLLISPKQLEVSNPRGRIRKVNLFVMHMILPSDHTVSSIPDEQVFGRRDKYINEPHILKEVVIIDIFLHENFLHVRIKKKVKLSIPSC